MIHYFSDILLSHTYVKCKESTGQSKLIAILQNNWPLLFEISRLIYKRKVEKQFWNKETCISATHNPEILDGEDSY